MDVLGDATARERRSGATALRVPSLDRSYDYRRFCTGAWKVGNLLRHHGVRAGARVAVADDPRPQSVSTLYGAAAIGAVVRFGPPGSLEDGVAVVVCPSAAVDRYDVGPGTKRIAYGESHPDPAVAHFESDVWSENPTEPPDAVAPSQPLLATPGGSFTHRDVLAAASVVVERLDLAPGSTVAVDAPFAHPGAVAAGLVAPVLAGATVCIGPGADGDVVVGDEGDVPPDSVLESRVSR